MYVKLHHLGIAVEDLEGARDLFQNVLGLPHSHTEEVPSEKARVSFFPVGESSLELVESSDQGSAISRYITKRGPGIHHVCLEVEDIHGMMKTLKERGVRFTSEKPGPGAHGAQVIFIHPKSAGGILIELRQGNEEEQPHG